MKTEISGSFTKIVFAKDLDTFLLRGVASRPAGRFNRPGQDALYLSQNVESARAALSRYVKADDAARVAVQYEIEQCTVLDLRHPEAADLLIASRENWQEAMAMQNTPMSWGVADKARKEGYSGLIDPSRQKAGAWHLVLFQWNEPNAPVVKAVGKQVSVQMT